MGYQLRRWFEDRLPQEISSGERVVALAIADLVWDDSRIGYGKKFMAKLLHKTGFENEAQLGKVLGKLAGRGIELRVPICGQDGKPLRNKRGQLVYAHRGHQRTFRVPLESEFPGRAAPYWNDDEERSPDRETNSWFTDERSPARETFKAESSPAREGYRGERSPARESMVTQAGDPIPLTTPSFPPSVTPRPRAAEGKAGSSKQQDPALTAATAFLQNLPQPWSVGRVTASAMAPQLLEVITEQGWQLDDELVTKLTERPEGVKQPSAVLRLRINDLPKAPRQHAPTTGPSLPPWCGECGDGNPAAEFNAKFRKAPGSSKPCLNCHPETQTAEAA
ncbi:hypothetical protein GLX30_30245 [Streptomyces sp. Tu 2975]|uniref:hypothetical protein n=1 Tax=Streptomyces sp. Tu 2975 TaxID=2676871 RepID=UPI00135B5F93|nr:hypothetical protein [Streptomyces sp. Tu 2975]QIP87597.1 hypothetical protein GLX30_30245 [Streptomyces sp. Tu 2975]